MKDIALLIGNGVNSISKGVLWGELLNELISKFGNNEINNNDRNKPFPLFYEEIFLLALRSNKIKKEYEIKKFIAEKVSEIQPNPVHQMIWDLKPAHVMTVNYEFLLEGTEDCRNIGIIQETLYSIFRKFEINGTTYWHLHGDCNHPMSINLGYEHYCGQLQQMRNYVASGTHYTSKKLEQKPLIRRLGTKGQLKSIQSWIDLFFTKDIHIIGMTMDFVEMDIWWLLSYRTRQMSYRKKAAIKNKIFYYIPEEYLKLASFKITLLEANGVKVVPIAQKHGLTYYQDVFKNI